MLVYLSQLEEKMTNNKKLIEEQRSIIQFMIDKKYSFTKIGKAITKHRTTVAEEIKRNRYIKSHYYEQFDKEGIAKAGNDCNILKNPPYVCNSCERKNKCSKHKLYYNSKLAQKKYEETIINARVGVDISPETIEEIEQMNVFLKYLK